MTSRTATPDRGSDSTTASAVRHRRPDVDTVKELNRLGVIAGIKRDAKAGIPYRRAKLPGVDSIAYVSPGGKYALIHLSSRYGRENVEEYVVAVPGAGHEYRETPYIIHLHPGELRVKGNKRDYCHIVSKGAQELFHGNPRREIRTTTWTNNGQRIGWDAADAAPARQRCGTYVVGFQAQMDGTPVFVKAIEDEAYLARLQAASAHLEARVVTNPELRKYIPKGHYVGGLRHMPDFLPDDGQTYVGVAVDELIDGPTITQWRDSRPLLADDTRGIATIGLHVARGIQELNKGIAPGQRLLATDLCKPDNVAVRLRGKGDRAQVVGIVFVDKDSFMHEADRTPMSIAGHPHFTPAYEIPVAEANGQRDFRAVEAVHVFQLGRLMAHMNTGYFPATVGNDPSPSGMYAECGRQSYSDAIMKVYDRYGHDGLKRAMGPLVAACMAEDQSQRPTLNDVVKQLRTILKNNDE